MTRQKKCPTNGGNVGKACSIKRKKRLTSLSEKRDSNSRPQPWQGCALPTELFSHFFLHERIKTKLQKTFKHCKYFFYLNIFLSEKRDSNSRPQPWQGCALPTELFSHLVLPLKGTVQK